MSGENEIRVFGPPGTGKTTWMAGSVRATAKARRTSDLVVGSFTRAAATEIAGRGLPVDRQQVGTLHALAYRAIDRPEVAGGEQIAEWNKSHPHLALSTGFTGLDEAPEAARGATEADKVLSLVDRLRAQMIPFDQWPSVTTQRFHTEWTAWKRANEVVDFTDMIELALTSTIEAPGAPVVGFFDEVQDFTPLELALVRHWGKRMDRLVLAGDDDQCQPDGSPVLTSNRGYVPIEELDPKVDRLVSFDRRGGSEIRGRRGGYAFARATRHHKGDLHRFNVDGRVVEVTSEHRLAARWRTDGPNQCVYLMEKRGQWRVGTSVLMRGNGQRGVSMFGPGFRARVEGADRLWVLSLHDTAAEAWTAEQTLSVRYGIPQATFTKGNRSTVPQHLLDKIHGDARPQAVLCLDEHRLRLDLPLWTADTSREQRGARAILTVRAVNAAVLAPALRFPCDNGTRSPAWVDVAHSLSYHDGAVHSLSVEPYGHYLTNGIVVHNSIYSFKGATPDAFLDPPIPEDQKRILSQSFRVPATVHAAAQQWVERLTRREPKDYEPRNAEGCVRQADLRCEQPVDVVRDVVRRLDERVTDDVTGESRPRTVMVLASCSYMLDRVKHELRKEGVPFHNPYRRSRRDWNPLSPSRGIPASERLLSYLITDDRVFGDACRFWTGEDVRRFASVLRKKGVFRRGAAQAITALPDRELTFPEVVNLFDLPEDELARALDPELRWFVENLLAGSRQSMEYPLAIARRDPTLLANEPQLILGTIHSVKGGQADSVYLFPDLSLGGMREWVAPGTARDSVVRLMYVGMTRAREELVLCEPSSPTAVETQLMMGLG